MLVSPLSTLPPCLWFSQNTAPIDGRKREQQNGVGFGVCTDIGTLLAQAIAFVVGYPGSEFPFITILLNVGLGIADEKQLKNAGHNTKGMGFWVILVPVYLFVRASRLKQKNFSAIVWIVSFLIALGMSAE